MHLEITPQALNRKQAAQYLGVAENTLRKLLDDGSIKFVQAGRRLIIPKLALDNYLSQIANGT